MRCVGVLEMQDERPDSVARFGDRTSWFRHLFSGEGDLIFEKHPVLHPAAVPNIRDRDAWIISGSRFSVYEDISWLQPMREFICYAVAQSVPLIGICFGHQLMAQAMGGVVEKSPKGLGIGVHEYRLDVAARELFGNLTTYRIMAAHQDQVITMPPQAVLVASSCFCVHAALAYGAHALSLQGHPEMTVEIERDIIEKSDYPNKSVLESGKNTLIDPRLSTRELAPVLARILRGHPISIAKSHL